MDRNYFNGKSLIAIVLLLLITVITHFFFDMSLDAYERGYRYWVLILELFVLPVFYFGAIIYIARTIYQRKIIDGATVKLLAKFFGFTILLVFLFFILGMIFNR